MTKKITLAQWKSNRARVEATAGDGAQILTGFSFLTADDLRELGAACLEAADWLELQPCDGAMEKKSYDDQWAVKPAELDHLSVPRFEAKP